MPRLRGAPQRRQPRLLPHRQPLTSRAPGRSFRPGGAGSGSQAGLQPWCLPRRPKSPAGTETAGAWQRGVMTSRACAGSCLTTERIGCWGAPALRVPAGSPGAGAAARGSPRPAPPLPRRALLRRPVPPEGDLSPRVPAGCGAGRGSAGSPSCCGSDGRREAPARAGLWGAARAVAAACRRTLRARPLPEKNETLDHLISLSGAVQLRHLSNNLEILLKRDFLKLLPLELSFYLLKWLDPQTLLTCCLVSKQWNKVISACTEVWQTACKNLGWQIDDSVQDPLHWKKVYLKAILRMKQLKDHEAFETSSLIGHSARVYALYYKDGLLCTGSDDLSAKLWDVSTGQCIYGIQTHTCAAVKFDEQKLVTGSFDNTVACWEWSSGAKTQHFRGHTGAVFSVDYNDELDILVSGSADFTVKVWALSTGTCLNTLTGHTEWVTKVVLQKCKVKSLMHSPGDYILLSADKYEIKIWPIGREINCKCLKTLSVSEDRSISLQPRLHFDGKYIVCSSALGLYQWDFASYDILRVIKPPDFSNVSLLGFGEIFALLFDSRYLYIMDLRTEKLISRWPLPEYRKSKRGSSFLAGEMSWLNGLNGQNDMGLVFATSMPDHSIHLVLWKEHG